MASLINCQPVISYTAQEFAGDTANGVEALELQSPPSGAILSSAEASVYYLVVQPLPSFKIDRTMISVSTITPTAQPPNDQLPNGMDLYFNFSGADSSLSDVVAIRVFDSLGVNYESCNNNVILEITLSPEFSMPNSNHTISVDIGGEAISCIPQPVVPEVVETNYQLPMQESYFSSIRVTNYSNQNNYNIFFAQYYETASDAQNIYNQDNLDSYVNWVPGDYFSGLYLPPYDWNVIGASGVYESLHPENYPDGCLNSFQPTCYTLYRNDIEELGFLNEATTDAPNVITTDCGQLLSSNPVNMQSIDALQNVYYHPNDSSAGINTSKGNYHFRYQGFTNTNSVLPYLSGAEFPNIEPGGPVIPTTLCWYVSIGENPNYNLIADSAFIDVWKIITGNKVGGGWPSGNPPTPSSSCDFASEDNFSYFISDSGVNNSDLDIDNITLTQVDNKTVKITIPFKSGLSISRTVLQLVALNVRKNLIFMNIYPVEI
jgi:hypothetical protein